MPLPPRILVFIPCYNCEPQIPRVIRQFDAEVAACVDEILVLDNGSKDGTVQAAQAAAAQQPGVTVLVGRNAANYNLGGSHKSAFAHAVAHGFTHVVVLHGDDQGAIRDLLPVLRAGWHLQYDACLGARFMPGSRLSGYSAFRILGNLVFNALFTLGARRAVWDLGSGLNIFGPAVIQDPKVHRYADDLRFNIYLLLGMFFAGHKTRFFPISWREDDQVSNVKMVSQALNTLKLLGQSVWQGAAFWRRDHRDVRHDSYRFETVAGEARP
jgi:dolichol-phosphate mannosyltransferase